MSNADEIASKLPGISVSKGMIITNHNAPEGKQEVNVSVTLNDDGTVWVFIENESEEGFDSIIKLKDRQDPEDITSQKRVPDEAYNQKLREGKIRP